jgi:hypothetical protein
MFFGFDERPTFLPTDTKVRREIKQVCSRDKKCIGSMSALSVINLFIAGHIKDISGIKIEDNSLGREVFMYGHHTWVDGFPKSVVESVDYGIELYKCTAEYNGHTYAWYEEKI